tara:strand:- start:267 stop:758 length:492 start_codon:yes stop_codon:yes gene_type:complete
MDFINILKNVVSEQAVTLITEGQSWSSTKISSPLKNPGRCNNYHQYRSYYKNGSGGYHDACDMPTSVGTALYAPHGGNFSESGGGSCGNGITIKGIDGDDKGLQSLFCHLRSREVPQSGKVKKGDLIGFTGGKSKDPGAGNSSGPHLHWTFKVNGTKTNPYTY